MKKEIVKIGKEKEVTIDKIVLNIGGKDLSVTVDEARKLQQALNQLFGTPPPLTVITYPVSVPVTAPQPSWPWRNADYIGDAPPFTPTITCTSTCGGQTFTSHFQ